MELWAAALLFIVCAGVAVVTGIRYRKSKKTGLIVLTVLASLLAFALLIYSGLALILTDKVKAMPAEGAGKTAGQTVATLKEMPNSCLIGLQIQGDV